MEFKNSQLMLIATVCTFILLVLLMFFPIPDANAQIFMAVSGIALAFFFGSSVNKARPNNEQRQGDVENAKPDPAVPGP